MLFFRFIAVLVVISTTFVQQSRGNVIGIDFGSDSMKIAIVQPGTPLEIGTFPVIDSIFRDYSISDTLKFTINLNLQ